MQVCVLPLDQLTELLKPEEPGNTPRHMLVIAAAHDGETLTMIRADGASTTVPLSVFSPSGCTVPDFSSLGLDDHGHTIRFGEYEAAADFALTRAETQSA